MSRIKTATTALTAAVLVTGIGLAVAQTTEPSQPADPMSAAPAVTPAPSEDTPADPNAQTQPVQPVPPTDAAAPAQQQATPPVDNARTPPPLPSDTMTRSTPSNAYPATSGSTGDMPSNNDGMTHRSEPAPRADRN